LGRQDIRVTGISDGEDTGTEKLTASSTKIDVVTVVMMDTSLGQHGVVFDLGLTERRTVTSNDDQLGYNAMNEISLKLKGGRSLPKKKSIIGQKRKKNRLLSPRNYSARSILYVLKF
jgi:hypothetical protein